MYVIEAVHFLLVGEKHVSVDLVYEHLVLYVLVDRAASLYYVTQLSAVRFVVLGLSIDNVDERAAVADGRYVCRRGLLEVVGAREVLNGKLDVGVVVDESWLDLVSRDKEEGLVRRHLLEDDTLDGGLARSI